MIAAASSQCRAHSARPYAPAEPGVSTSRRKRFIQRGLTASSREVTGNARQTQSVLSCGNVKARAFRRGRGGARVRSTLCKENSEENLMAQAQRKQQARDWPFEVKPLHPVLGCEITGITLAQAVEPTMFGKVYEAFLDYELILFRDVDLPPATQVAFARRFGEIQIHVMNQYQKYPEFPEIYMLTNADKDGKPTGKHPDKGTLHWHTDGSWRERTGQATMMYSEIVPPAGGETEFADMYSAYDNLPAEMKKRIEGKRAIHNLDFSRTRRHGEDPMTAEQKAKVPPIAHPIVRTHPETGRKAVFLGDHAQEIEGMDYDEGRALIEELNVLITPQDQVYTHVWSPRECMVWDNRCTLHRATGFDEANHVRVMRRCTINGDRPY
ncbi:MAG: TauD/TfdA family dioxygenase [Alphaproteobacteria bacterium]|nr:MAG: TauD/TfdA family dioxygenase [Alphaproteobacteria bacterium]